MVGRFATVRTQLVVLLYLLGWSGDKNDFGCEALQYQTLDNYSTTEECALVLDGPGRSSAYDYTYNLLRGSVPPSAGSHTCITYDAVNRAYVEARKRVNVAQPHGDTWRPEDLATVGELLLDVSTSLAQTYGLTYEEIQNSLPLIDTSKTLIREICPAYLSDVECRPGKYRRYDGLCTNLENPTWGSTLSPFTRLLNPAFPDGLSAPRISVTGDNLPLSRIVSRTMHPDEGYHDHAGTVMVIAWGQFMDHDYTLTGTPLDPMNRNDPEECCHRPVHQKNPYCNEIVIPEDDYFYRLFGVRCMDFVRAFPAARPGCRLGSRVPFNLLTGVLDGNTVYGISETFARKLRTGYGGLLRMNPVFSEYGLKDLLPLKLDIPDEGCTRPNRSMYCFEAGEIRVNEQLVLTCMHTLLAREHNRAAKALSQVNPHWDDETTFQEARRIVIAEIQHVTYNEFLPILLGKDVMEKFGLILEKHNYWDGYDPSVNPGVIDAFAAAAFRFGHSLLPTAVERWSKAHKFIASKRLSDLIRRPWDLYRAGVLDEYFMGLMNQVAQAMDDSITQEVTNHLFKKVGAKFGMDLVSFNMQRGREFGIPGYMDFRKFCGLSGADTFEGLFGSMPNETIRRYSSIFQHPSDVDLWSGGVSERPLPGSMLGPTFACVIATQFSYSRRGDRFWYELPNQPSSFTLEQLNEIRKARLARLICDNTDLIDTIQLYPMVLPDHEINPRVPCRSGVLPGIDFSKWAEFPTTSHAAQYSDNFKAFLPLPIVYAEINRVGWIPASRNTKLVQLLRVSMPSMGMIYSAKKNRDRYKRNKKPGQSLTLRKFVNYLRPENEDRDVVKISAIVKHIHGRTKRHSDSEIESVERGSRENFLKRRKHWTGTKNIEETPKRSRSMIGKTSQKDATKMAKFLRHFRSTMNDGSKRRETRAVSHEGRRKPRKSPYKPILNECNDTTAASEVEDLNIPPPRSKYSKTLVPLIRDIDFPEENNFHTSSGKSSDPLKMFAKAQKTEEPHPPKSPEVSLKSPSPTLRQSGYVNLRDHQEKSRSKNSSSKTGSNSSSLGYPRDIRPYNPADIPYVEVPDYTDQREESLDEDDRRVAKDRYTRRNKKAGELIIDEDVVDPDVPAVSDSLPDPGKNPESARSTGKSESTKERYKDTRVGGERYSGLSFRVSNDTVRNNDRSREEPIYERNNEERIENQSRLAQKSAIIEESVGRDDNKTDRIKEKSDDRNKDDGKPFFYFEPVHFDIADYTRPLNFDELFGEEETNDSKDEAPSERITTDSVEYLPEMFPERYEESAETAGKSEDFYFDDKDFLQPGGRDKTTDRFNGESGFLSRYFNDDVVRSLKSEENEKSRDKDSRESSAEEREDSYETIPTSLRKKNRRLKFADNESKKARSADGPRDYNKFWTLEYSSPAEKINAGLREEISADERNKK